MIDRKENCSPNIAYCFLSGMVLDSQLQEIEKFSKTGIQNAPNIFQKALIDGLRDTLDSLDVINLPFIGAFPLNYKKLYSPKSENIIIFNSNKLPITIFNKAFNDLILYKFHSRKKVCKEALIHYCEKNKGKDKIIIFIYSVHLPFMRAVAELKGKYNIQTVLIVTDLPEFKNDTLPFYKSILYNYDTHVTTKDYNQIDSFILLSKKMAERIIFSNQPFVIIEGIFQEDNIKPGPERIHNVAKRIFYSGTLARRYSIMNLVSAVRNIPDENIELLICGSGGCEEEIVKISQEDKRIRFLGSLPHAEVLRLQRSADLLVNPRTPEGEFTKFSFPSKTMEYLASGTPTLLYKLEGIPDEYYDYCFTIEHNDIENLSNKIMEILSLPLEERIEIGNRAKTFISSKKNPREQCAKVLSLIK